MKNTLPNWFCFPKDDDDDDASPLCPRGNESLFCGGDVKRIERIGYDLKLWNRTYNYSRDQFRPIAHHTIIEHWRSHSKESLQLCACQMAKRNILTRGNNIHQTPHKISTNRHLKVSYYLKQKALVSFYPVLFFNWTLFKTQDTLKPHENRTTILVTQQNNTHQPKL